MTTMMNNNNKYKFQKKNYQNNKKSIKNKLMR